MKFLHFILALTIASATASAQTLTLAASDNHAPITLTADASSGLSNIIVAYSTAGVTATFTTPGYNNVSVSTFSSAGAAYGTPIAAIGNGNQVSVTLQAGDTGLTFDVAGDRQYHYWIVDYSQHRLALNSLALDPNESDCATAALTLQGNASPITYYTINGAPRTLSRELTLQYKSLVYNESSDAYVTDHIEKSLASASSTIHVTQPLCATSFTLSGDAFTRQWGEESHVETPIYEPTAVEAHTSARNLNEAPDNLSSSAASDGLGGNAPAEIEFSASVSDAVVFTEWQLSTDPNFNIVDYRFQSTDVTHTFSDYGTTYARFVAANNSGDCEYTSGTYEINIGASKLTCPNAFSPGDQNGVNDEWKVNYASLTEFECNIFNRWGVHIIKLTHPSQGWDGRYGGKIVPSGVYYYVIKARGADGVDYKLSGDINVINYTIKPGYASPSE